MKTIKYAFIALMMFPILGYGADAAAPAASPEAVVAAVNPVVAVPDVSNMDLLGMMLKLFSSWQSAGMLAGMSALVMLIIASLKNSMLRAMVWDKLKWGKVFVAPVMSIVLVFMGMMAKGMTIDGKAVLAALFVGGGAVALHEILDGLKQVPGIGGIWVNLIDMAGKLLGKPSDKPSDQQPK